MTIYGRMGGQMKIILNAGIVTPKEDSRLQAPANLVMVQYDEPNEPDNLIVLWRLAEFLKADDGWTEIEIAISKAPQVRLTPDDLQRAMWQAL